MQQSRGFGRSVPGQPGLWRVGAGVEPVVSQQFEPVHGQTQISESAQRRSIVVTGLHATLHAVEALAQRAELIGIPELAEEPADFVRPSARPSGQFHGIAKLDPAGPQVLEHAAFKHAALPGPVPIEPAGAIRAQGMTGLGKAGNGSPGARGCDRQAERL